MNEDESRAVDPYEAVLNDLRAKRDKLDQAIALIEGVRNLAVPTATGVAAQSRQQNGGEIGPGTFHGMSIPEAAKKLLSIRKQQLSNQDIATAFSLGGLILQSENPANTIGSVLTRRFQQVGDVVKTGRGKWGLAEWHPTIRYKPKADKKGEEETPTTEDRPPLRILPNPKKVADPFT